MVPLLWGKDTFNDGAGLARLITFATFIRFNMPHGVDYFDPRLSVAAGVGPGGLRAVAAAAA